MSSNDVAASPPTLTTSRELASRQDPLRPLPVIAVKAAMREYQEGLHALLDATDWQTFTSRGEQKRFVKRAGWRKIGTWFALDLLIKEDSVTIDRDVDGRPLRARLVARVVAPNGRKGEDIGACSINERTFSKPEHDLLATAATRALNRATSNLVGMGELSAEEVLEDAEPILPEWAQPAPPQLGAAMHAKLVDMVGDERARKLTQGIHAQYGGTPKLAVGLVVALHRMLEETRAEAEPAPEQPTEGSE